MTLYNPSVLKNKSYLFPQRINLALYLGKDSNFANQPYWFPLINLSSGLINLSTSQSTYTNHLMNH